MSLFRYKVLLADDTVKTSTITAKTKEAAQKRVAELNKVKEWISIKEEKTPVPTPVVPQAKTLAPTQRNSTPKPIATRASTRLDKLLYLQSSKCFFCGKELSKSAASVEHLWPKSKGGTDADGNVVACCVTLNRTFGSMELKEKVRFILAQKGDFVCPK